MPVIRKLRKSHVPPRDEVPTFVKVAVEHLEIIPQRRVRVRDYWVGVGHDGVASPLIGLRVGVGALDMGKVEDFLAEPLSRDLAVLFLYLDSDGL